MHRGYPADKVVADMMREIHRYFGFPKQNVMAVGLGGGHSGFTVAVLHLMSSSSDCHVFVDTPKPESEAAQQGGAFRQSWGVQLLELQKFSKNGDAVSVELGVCILSEVDSDGALPLKLTGLPGSNDGGGVLSGAAGCELLRLR